MGSFKDVLCSYCFENKLLHVDLLLEKVLFLCSSSVVRQGLVSWFFFCGAL